jgi:hypothetical protein
MSEEESFSEEEVVKPKKVSHNFHPACTMFLRCCY